VLDWATRRVLSWRLSITMEAAFCVETLEDALARHGKPEIFNTDQGSQFTGSAFTGLLAGHGIAISMDGKGAWRDNVFVERLWRSVKYEEVYLRAYESVGEARTRSADTSISTMATDRIRALTTPHRIKPTSTNRHSAWRPNPGRRSTYRRGNSVQTTGTSSIIRIRSTGLGATPSWFGQAPSNSSANSENFSIRPSASPWRSTRHGRREFVLMSAEHYDWLTALQRATRTIDASEVVIDAVERAEMDPEHTALDELLK